MELTRKIEDQTGNVHYEFQLNDGRMNEAVKLNIPHLSPSNVLCLSTQIGCPFAEHHIEHQQEPGVRPCCLSRYGIHHSA